MSEGTWCRSTWKVFGSLVVLAMAGPTITDLTTFLVASTAWLVLLFSPLTVPPRPFRLLVIAVLLVTGAIVKLYFSAPPIEEGQGVFVPDGTSAYRDALPVEVHNHLLEGFRRAFNRKSQCALPDKDCWLDRIASAPPSGFAFGSESLVFPTRYTRKVWKIDFHSRETLPLFALNDLRYNFFPPNSRTWVRKQLPYFVAYTIPVKARPPTLCWRGDVFLPGPNGHYEHHPHSKFECKTLPPDDHGPIFGAETPEAPLAMSLESTRYVIASRVVGVWLGYAVAWTVVLLITGLPLRKTVVIPLGALAATLGWGLFLEPLTYTGVRLHTGGSDGLGYESFARTMAESAANGNWHEALKGVEPIFWSMPGLRYFLATAKPIFGDTLFAYLLACVFLGVVFHRLSTVFLTPRAAAILTGLYLLTPVFEFFRYTHYIYVKLVVDKGLAETLGYLLILAASTPVVAALANGRKHLNYSTVFLVGLSAFAAIAVRPNLAPTSAVLLSVLSIAYIRRTDWSRLGTLCLGFAPIGLLGWHNYYYGNEFHLLTMTGDHPDNLEMPPLSYLTALGQVSSANFSGAEFQKMLRQFSTWNGLSDFYRVFVFLVVVWVAFANRTTPALRLLACLALSQQATLFFFHASGRYAFLAWALTFLVFVVVFLNDILPSLRARSRPVSCFPRNLIPKKPN